MEILGIGPMELILLLIVALAVFGPDRLPQIGAKLGRAMRDMRKATRAISDEINSTRAAIEAPAKELAEPFKEVADVAKVASAAAASVRNPGQALRDSVLKELNTAIRPADVEADAPAGENTIAPPLLAAPGVVDASPRTEPFPISPTATETEPALSTPEDLGEALPAPDESQAALPTPEASSVRQENDPSTSDEEDWPLAGPNSRAPSPPEQ